jgi:hypothetical protein
MGAWKQEQSDRSNLIDLLSNRHRRMLEKLPVSKLEELQQPLPRQPRMVKLVSPRYPASRPSSLRRALAVLVAVAVFPLAVLALLTEQALHLRERILLRR